MYCQQCTCEHIIEGAIRQRTETLATSASICCSALDLRYSERSGDDRSVAVSSAAKPMGDCAGFTPMVIVQDFTGNCHKVRVEIWKPGDEGTETSAVACGGGDGDSSRCVPHPFAECDNLMCPQIVLRSRHTLLQRPLWGPSMCVPRCPILRHMRTLTRRGKAK